MHSFEFAMPTRVCFGIRAHENLRYEVSRTQAQRIAVIYGSERAARGGLLAYIKIELGEMDGKELRFFGGVQPNPLLEKVLEITDACREFDPQLILAVGGGSVIDTAKGVALALANPDRDLWELWTMEFGNYESPRPIGVIGTYPSSGSETCSNAVLTNGLLHDKRGFSSPSMYPAFALLNPMMASTLDSAQAAQGVTMILMHTLERCFTREENNELTDALAFALLRTVLRFADAYIEDPGNTPAASEIMWAACLSHCGLTGLGRERDYALHQLGNEVSGLFDLPMPQSLSALFPAWIRYVLPYGMVRIAQIGRAVFDIDEEEDEKAAWKMVEYMEAWLADHGMPLSLPQALRYEHFTDEKLEDMAHRCSRQGRRAIGSIKRLNKADMLEIYKKAAMEG